MLLPRAPDSTRRESRTLIALETAPQEVSIIVIAYNNAATLPECFSSLARQTYPYKAIVVVCDRTSPDETEPVVDSLMSTQNHSVAIKCDNVGRSKARNLGWQSVSSPIVMFADGDDVYEKTYVEKAVAALKDDANVGGVCLGGTALKKDGGILSKYYETYGATDVRVEERSGSGPEWAWVYRHKCLEEAGGFDEGLAQAEDKDLCARVKKAGYRIAYVGGTNWYRRKPERIRGFVKKEYLGGKRRVVYELKNDEYRSVLTNAIPAIYLVFALALAPIWERCTHFSSSSLDWSPMVCSLSFEELTSEDKARLSSGSLFSRFRGGWPPAWEVCTGFFSSACEERDW